MFVSPAFRYDDKSGLSENLDHRTGINGVKESSNEMLS